MKKVISIICLLLVVFSCAVTKSTPSWSNIGYDGVYIEYCRDTVTYEQLDSVLNSNNIDVKLNNWSKINFYTVNKNNIEQFTYTKYDTLYVVNKLEDNYIFTARCINKDI